MTLSNNTLKLKVLTAEIQQANISDFAKLCYLALLKVPKGRVITYKGLAQLINKPKAARAVGSAMHNNIFSPNVPCHRVVKSDGSIGGYAQGNTAKIKILTQEGIKITNNKVADSQLYKII